MNILFVIPGDINQPTGGYRYDKEMIDRWQLSGHGVELVQLPGNYPFPSSDERSQALAQIPEQTSADVAVVDGLAGGAHPELLAKLSKSIPVVALVHHPLCLENGLNPEQANDLKHSEAAALNHTACVVTTSPMTANTVVNLFGYDHNQIHSVLPGVERWGVSEPPKGPVNMLCVGSVIERKGHRILIEALARLKHLEWQLDCAGPTTSDPDLYEDIENLVKTNDLTDRITFHGAVERSTLENLFQSAHVFVLPSKYEGYGMAYAEAIVAGLPVIGTTGGAIPDTVPPNCGILVEPDDVGALSSAIETMVADPQVRERFRQGAMEERSNFPDWITSSERFAAILQNIVQKAAN